MNDYEKMSKFWVVIEIEAKSLNDADHIACAMSEDVQGRVIQVDSEPPPKGETK